MGIVDSLAKRFLQQGTIEHKSQLSDTVYHIKIKSENIKSAEFTAGYFLRIGIGIDKDKLVLDDFVRSYSVWDIDQTKGTIDLAVATHSKGAGARWAAESKVGDNIYFTWKKGSFLVDETADSYLMIGDLSSLSHLYVIARNLSKNKRVESILYSPDKNELFADIDGKKSFSFYEMPQNPTEEIIEKINAILPKLTGKKIVYVGGDSRVCLALNQYFRRELQWDARQIKTKAFWNPEKKGLE